ncbi:reverse transcriptase domain-containing protein [Tanacetum coccineum]
MLAIPHHSQVFSMAVIDSKGRHKEIEGWDLLEIHLTQQAHLVFALTKEAQACMRTRSQARRLRQQQLHQQQVPPNLVELPIVTMADNRTMAELLQAPTEGYEDAIVVPEIEAANFEIKHGLLTLVQNKQFFGHDKEDPHAHIRYFNKITSTLRYPNVPTTSIKLMLFPFSLEGAARIWLEKEPPRSIQTWDDLVAKFINQFFPPSKTTNLRNEITNFKQKLISLVELGSIQRSSSSNVRHHGNLGASPTLILLQCLKCYMINNSLNSAARWEIFRTKGR